MNAARARLRGPAGTALRATYRVQLRAHGLDFAALERALPGIAQLGVSHLYLSPIFAARSGSEHGYDGTDPRRVDPALGGVRALRRLARAARARGLGLVVDWVPNHLAADLANPWFADLLARGPRSPYASWFDVDWDAAGGRIVLPWLPASRSDCIASGHLRLEQRGGEPRLRCGGLSLPLAAGSAPQRGAGSPAVGNAPQRGAGSPAALAQLLERQCYALDPWRRARRRLNYRRFFDIDELIAVRADRPEVFEALHAGLLTLLAEGVVGGVRVDHVDGIADPAGYLRRLRRALDAAAGPAAALWVEKILAPDEALPARWPVAGTTGYEFLNQTEALFLDAGGVRRLERDWAQRVGARGGFAAEARRGRRRVLRGALAPDVGRVARRLAALPETGRAGPDALAAALRALLAQLDVYRVYPDSRGGLSAAGRRRLERAFAAARAGSSGSGPGLAALRRVLLAPAGRGGAARRDAARAVGQLAAAAAAKGVEDTAFYVWTPLLSRNEVGNEPGEPPERALRAFHAANRARQRRHPRGLLATSTHDTKRSADLRARLDVLSEIPEAWRDAQERWLRWNAPAARALRRRARDPRAELLAYQTLVGLWPLQPRGRAPSRAARRRLADRLEAYLVKATREAGRDTSWIDPDAGFEEALRSFARALLQPDRSGETRFLADLSRFAREVARPGLWNALSRCVLQLGSPGVPDVYQGDELWRFELVDPDNRRPVDFASRARALRELDAAFASGRRAGLLDALMVNPEDGRLKLHVLRRGLAARAASPELFTRGEYRPLVAQGPLSQHVVAFARRAGSWLAVIAVPRCVRGLVPDPESAPLGADVWGDTRLALPRPWAGAELSCALTGEQRVPGRHWPLAELFAKLPVALWVGSARASGAADALDGRGRAPRRRNRPDRRRAA